MSYSLKEFQSIKMYHRADQGPCSKGFHIGSKDEWDTVLSALTTLGVANETDTMTYLKMPAAYYLNRTNGSKNTSYGTVRIWTSTMTNNTTAYCFYINENHILAVASDKPGNAFSIRPFKDNPITPDSSWTTLYQGTGSAGIFWNSTLGLISISGNGTTWTTMTDKNLGATNVGDDGLYYQFGNNYGFTVSPTTYYTSKVSNTQAYGPSNYYNDEHFIRVSSGNGWFTDTNNNIRGGVDQAMLYPMEVKEVWLGNHKVYPGMTLVLQGSTGNVYTDGENYLFGVNDSNIIMSVKNTFNTYDSTGYHVGYAEEFYLLRNRLTDHGISWTDFLDLYNIGWYVSQGVTTKSYGMGGGYSAGMLDTRDGMQFYNSFQWSTNQGGSMTLEFADANFSNYNQLVPSGVIASSNFSKRFPVYLGGGARISVSSLTDLSTPYMNRTSIISVPNPELVSGRSVSPWYTDTYGINIAADMQMGDLMVGRNRGDGTIVHWTNSGQITKTTVSLVVRYMSGSYEIEYDIKGEDMQSGSPVQIDYGTYLMSYSQYYQVFENPFLRVPDGYSGSDNFSGSISIY